MNNNHLNNPMTYMNADGLKPNGSSSRIKLVQDALNKNFGASLTVNGLWDEDTEAALVKAGYNAKQLSAANVDEIMSGNVSSYLTLPKTAKELDQRVAQHQMTADYNTNKAVLDQKYGSSNLAGFMAKAAKDYTVKTPGTEGYTQTIPVAKDKKPPITEGKKTIWGIPTVSFIIGACLLAAIAITGTVFLVRRHNKAKQPVPAVKYTVTK